MDHKRTTITKYITNHTTITKRLNWDVSYFMNSFYQELQEYIKNKLFKLNKPNTINKYYIMTNKIHIKHKEQKKKKKKEKKPDNT